MRNLLEEKDSTSPLDLLGGGDEELDRRNKGKIGRTVRVPQIFLIFLRFSLYGLSGPAEI